MPTNRETVQEIQTQALEVLAAPAVYAGEKIDTPRRAIAAGLFLLGEIALGLGRIGDQLEDIENVTESGADAVRGGIESLESEVARHASSAVAALQLIATQVG